MKMQQPKQAIGRLIGSDVLKFIIGHKILLIFEFLHAPCKFRLFNSSSSPELSWVNTVSENVNEQIASILNSFFYSTNFSSF
jgi:hypothetical protein